MPHRIQAASFTPVILVLIACCESTAIAMTVPSLPLLYARAAGTDDIAIVFGLVATIFAIVNMMASPVLGTLSDRYGRRPFLVLSLGMAAAECMVMAFVPILSILIMWRVLSGLTSSTATVLAAWLADITPADGRTRRFGYLNASYGIGLFIGPLTGGVLAERWLSAPYIVAGMVAAVGLVLAAFVPARPAAQPAQTEFPAQTHAVFNPFRHLLWLGATGLAPLALVYFAVNFSFGSPDALWAIYTIDRFQFTPSTIGLTLALFGLFYAIAQVFLAGTIATRFGQKKTAMIGISIDACSMLTLAFTATAWMVFPLLAPLSFGSISMPAIQSLMSNRVDSTQQGRLQGALGSVVALAGAVAPLACNAVYAATSKTTLPGAAWLLPVALYAMTVPIWLILRRRAAEHRLSAANVEI